MSIQVSVSEYFIIGFALVLLGRTIHYLTVTRYLRERGVLATIGRSPIRDWGEWAAYRKARLSDHQSLTWWYVLWAIQIVLFFWIMGWFAYAGGALKIGRPSHFVDTAADTAGYRIVFDVEQSGYRHWGFAASGLIFVAVGFAMPALFKLGIARKPPAWMQKWLPRIFVIGATLWTVAVFAATFVDYRRAVDALHNGEAKVVEGRVDHYSQVATKSESFDVNGVKFWYSDGVLIAGFNHTAFEGGPIRQGLGVKIWYWHGQILRLQIKSSEADAFYFRGERVFVCRSFVRAYVPDEVQTENLL